MDSNAPNDSSSSSDEKSTPAAAAASAAKRKLNPKPAPAKRKKTSNNSNDDGEADEDEAGSRFRWTDELHQYFLACIFELGLEAASPKKVFTKMVNEPELSKYLCDEEMIERMYLNITASTTTAGGRGFLPSHVKSHLQRFRSNVPDPKRQFITQVAELMERAKEAHLRDKQQNVTSKVLNPQFHAYPFDATRQFPNAANLPALPQPLPAAVNTPMFGAITSDLQLLDPSMLLTAMPIAAPAAAQAAPALSNNAAASSSSLVTLETAQKMQIQTELRQQIELRFQDSLVANIDQQQQQQQQQQQPQYGMPYNNNNSSTAFMLNQNYGSQSPTTTQVNHLDNDDDNLFEWLDAPDDFFGSSMPEDVPNNNSGDGG